MEDIAPMIVGIAFFVLVGFIIWVVVDGRRRREHLKIMTDFNNRLVERLGSIAEFSQFLQTDGGARFLATLSTERPAIGPKDRILRAVHVGTILIVVGIGALVLSAAVASTDKEPFMVIGVIVLALGVGYLLSSAASYRLAKTLGVLDEPSAGKSAQS